MAYRAIPWLRRKNFVRGGNEILSTVGRSSKVGPLKESAVWSGIGVCVSEEDER